MQSGRHKPATAVLSPLPKPMLRSAQGSRRLRTSITDNAHPVGSRPTGPGGQVIHPRMGCARSNAANRLGCREAQSSMLAERRTEDAQLTEPTGAERLFGYFRDLLPTLHSPARVTSYFRCLI